MFSGICLEIICSVCFFIQGKSDEHVKALKKFNEKLNYSSDDSVCGIPKSTARLARFILSIFAFDFLLNFISYIKFKTCFFSVETKINTI